MTKKKRRNNGCAGGCCIALFVAALLICVAVIAGLKLTDKIRSDLDQKMYPLKYTDIIYRYSDEYDVPKSVILAMIKVESNFREDAVSHVGACGLMQLMPETFTWLASKLGEEVTEDNIFDPEMNIKYGVYYISTLYESLGNWDNVYAAYNAGKGNVLKWLADERYSKDGVLTDIPFEETANHVVKLRNAREKYIELYHIGE